MKQFLSPFIALVLFFSINFSLFSQPVKLWTSLIGGNQSEYCNAVLKYNDTMMIGVGRTSSSSLNAKGLDDLYICEFSPATGKLISHKAFGTTSSEVGNALVKMPDGSMIIAGGSQAKGGDITANWGLQDAILFSFDPIKNVKLWDKNIGGTNADLFNDIHYLEPGKIIAVGSTKSPDKDLTGNKGLSDILVATVSENGTVVRVKNFGGTKDETAKKIIRQNGADFLVVGETETASDGDFASLTNHGKKDIFIYKFNRNTSPLTTSLIGGPGRDEVVGGFYLSDGSNILICSTDSIGGDVQGTSKGLRDLWLVKVNANGSIAWSKVFGGKKDDTPIKAEMISDNEFMVLLNSSSNDGDIPVNYGNPDLIMMKFDLDGNLLFEMNYGGAENDAAGALFSERDGLIYVVGSSFSKTRDLPASNTQAPDFWIMKFLDCKPVINNYTKEACIGDTVHINGKIYFSGKSSGSDTLVKGTVYGCDSIINVNVNFNVAQLEILRDTLCNGETRTINNIIFDKNHTTQTIPLQSYLGCDSTLIVELTFNSEIKIKSQTVNKDNGTGNGSIEFTPEGGTPPYQYDWGNGNKTNSAKNLISGNYRCTVSDARACVQEFSFIVQSNVATKNIASEVYVYQDANFIYLETEALASVELFNGLGQMITNPTITDTKNGIKINKAKFAKGLILLDIRLANGGNSWKKIIIY